ncbi:MAG TPA: DUF1365 domain-containing protein [Candidatus Accumulibacter phosphatis]|nr:MAG: hypothetical protein AW07_01466 [Candidatus Accumulibacter sp. SK-11]HAY28240.1 DUF1365 domain-containing protein [Accumulibacter sp.]HRL75093.1 DUF1365 domain-containing protein [Candidatus Accumulibacter phosphatis]HCN68296.1 DUF1365 domain-containing protein [Accumulibacter sp.]HCV12219.1 DUF1365 domain-containing protein [Accumulibacter sp.]
MSASVASLFVGQVMHRRLRPVSNRFVYPVYYCLLPLTRIEEVGSRFFSINRRNLFSFHFADHGARDGSHPLPWVRQLLQRQGIAAEGEIWLQCFPRVLGHVFNPVSFWFCHNGNDQLVAVIAEVNNTFGEHHQYLLRHADGRPIRDGETIERDKVFHVSPFMAVAGHYRFRFHSRGSGQGPGCRRLARIEHADAGGDLLHTAISGDAQPLTTGPLLRAFVRVPLLSVGIVLRIHWQALRLWLKRVPFFAKPQPPAEELSP